MPEKWLENALVGEPEPTNEAQMEAQARVLIARAVSKARSVHCECTSEVAYGVSVDDARREATIMVRRARKLAFEQAAKYVADALDYDVLNYDTLVTAHKLPDEFRQVLRRVHALANMLRGPDPEGDR